MPEAKLSPDAEKELKQVEQDLKKAEEKPRSKRGKLIGNIIAAIFGVAVVVGAIYLFMNRG
jgi:uncharacterized membrane protein YcjF (UPF0283 family)